MARFISNEYGRAQTLFMNPDDYIPTTHVLPDYLLSEDGTCYAKKIDAFSLYSTVIILVWLYFPLSIIMM